MPKPDTIPGYVRITEVKDEFLTSRKTVERRRDRARERGESKVYGMFRLRTKDGQMFVEPKLEQVLALTKEGRVPEWFVARAWLEKEFGRRGSDTSRQGNAADVGQPSIPVHQVLDTIRQHYEAHISDLKDQIVAAERREQQALEYAERDKQRFAAATQSLTQLLALPGLTEAAKQQASKAEPGEGSGVSEAGAIVDQVNETSTVQPNWFQRLFKRRP